VTESPEGYELSNMVETALARTLVFAAEAKRWDVVVRIAEELGRLSEADWGARNYRTANTRTSMRGR